MTSMFFLVRRFNMSRTRVCVCFSNSFCLLLRRIPASAALHHVNNRYIVFIDILVDVVRLFNDNLFI